MRIKKKVQGYDVILEYERIKDYPNGYSLYDVYKLTNERKFLYRTCLTDLQVKEIVLAGYTVSEEEIS